jgi:hypothetical protein
VVAACSIPSKTASDAGTSTSTTDSSSDAPPSDTAPQPDADPGAPQLTLTGMPATDGNQTTVTFTYTVTMQAAVECRLDALAYAACPPPSKTFTGVVDGIHTFDARATVNGHTGSIPTYAFTVDTVPPMLAITAQPPAQSNQTTASFQFTIDDATTVTCQLDALAAAPCTSPATYAGLADGAHVFKLQGIDAAGNVATKTASWSVDTVPPTLMITMEPPAVSTVSSANFSFTSSGATSVTCQIDAQAPVGCTTSASYTGLADGSHTFKVVATDAATNMTTKSYTWMIDTTPPTLAITAEPANPTNSPSATFMFTVTDTDPVSATCRLDAQTAAACTSPQTYAGLADGSHTFTLKGTDSAGNVATKTYTWTVDTIPPVLAFTSTPANPTNQTSGSFAFTIDDSVTVTCQLDGGVPNACTSPYSFTGLADGSHSFTLRGTDAAGNASSKSYVWTVDTVPPTISLSGPSGWITSKSATFTFAVSKGAPACSEDLSPSFACSSPFTWTSLPDGSHTFSVSATDAAGNFAIQSVNIMADATPPAVSTPTYTCDATSGSLTVSWTASDATSGIASGTCSYNGSSWDCTNARSYTGLVMGTATTFFVTYTDNAGNSITRSVVVRFSSCV